MNFETPDVELEQILRLHGGIDEGAGAGRLRTIDQYSGSLSRDIKEFKEGQMPSGRRSEYSQRFASFISQNLPEDYNLSDYDYILPLPSSVSSLEKRRGFSPIGSIGEDLSELTGIPLAPNVLEDISTGSRRGLSRAERIADAENERFRLLDAEAIRGKKVLLLDDVGTRFHTIESAVRAVGGGEPAQLDALVMAKRPWLETYDKAKLNEMYRHEGVYSSWLETYDKAKLDEISRSERSEGGV